MYQRINRNSTGQFLRGRERMVHISAPIIRNPQAVIAEAVNEPFFGPQFIVDKGTTFKPGRNKAKRERRARRFG